jgi:3-dehydro-L-gulonate 2-dehydrogenase
MKENPLIIYVAKEEMQEKFFSILNSLGFSKAKASQCAEVFTSNSLDGVYTHGVNRFPRFVQYIKEGVVKVDAEPSLENKTGAIEQWNGNLGPGILNAITATENAMRLAEDNGIGCVALKNTNHWMRGGTYGWHAAKKGFVFIGWTNTIANMPAWGAKDARLGNNPLIMALPYGNEAIVLDMAMSQFSFGAMEQSAMNNTPLSVYGGFDKKGELTNDPKAVLESMRPLPIGYWKGAGLALLLDLLATVLSGGLSTYHISKEKPEHSLSQVFIAIDISKLNNYSMIRRVAEEILNDYHQSIPVDESKRIVYPGERAFSTRNKNLLNGIPVLKKVWEEIESLNL